MSVWSPWLILLLRVDYRVPMSARPETLPEGVGAGLLDGEWKPDSPPSDLGHLPKQVRHSPCRVALLSGTVLNNER